MTDATNTSAAHAAALAMRDAAAALARRRPLYDGASGEPADEDLAQAIEDLPLPDAALAELERVQARGWPSTPEDARGMVSERTEPADGCGACGDMQKNIQYLDGLRHGWSAHAADLAQRVAGLEAERLRAERDAALAELERAREVLRYVEWLPGDLRPDEPCWCMVCMSYAPQHAPDCALNAALAAKGE